MWYVVEGIRAAAARNAYAPALITEGRVVNYGELQALVARISNNLADRRLPARSKLFFNIADADLRAVAMISAIHAGHVPLALLQPGDRSELGDHIVVAGGRPHVPDLGPDLVLEPEVIKDGDPRLREFADRADDELLFVTSTTGTTGTRKLVAGLAGASRAVANASWAGFTADDRIMMTVGDLTAGGVTFLWLALAAGGAHVRYQNDPARCLRFINFVGATNLSTTPSTITGLMDEMERAGARAPSVSRILLFGSLFQKRLVERVERLFDAEITVSYGSTEAGSISFGRLKSDTFEVGYVGELVPGITMIASGSRANPERLTFSNAEGCSPYYVAGRLVPAATGLITLPDIGYMEGQSLYLLGRDDEVFNVSGNKTAFSLIEHALLALPGVVDVGIVGGAAIGEPAAIVVALAGSDAVELGAVAGAVRRVAKVPATDEARLHAFKLDTIPRNVMGKVDRDAVIRAFRQRGGAG
ncbi:MAG: AMP-binding protein [Bauldia sp.]